MKNISFAFLFILCAMIMWNDDFLPNKHELTDLEFIQIIGLDEDDSNHDKVVFSFTQNNTKSLQTDEQDSNPSETVFSIHEDSFSKAIERAQTYTDKRLSEAHSRVILIGQNSAQKGIARYIDFCARQNDLNLNTDVFIVQDDTAEHFMAEGSKEDFKIEEKISNLDSVTKSTIIPPTVTLIDILKRFAHQSSAILIPTIRLAYLEKSTPNNNTSSDLSSINQAYSEPSKTPVMDFSGLAIIKNTNLIGFLDKNQTTFYTLLKNSKLQTSMIVSDETGFLVGLMLTSSKTDISFDFDKNELKQINIKLKTISNIQEVTSNTDVFTKESIDFLQKKQADLIKTNIYDLINISQKYKSDFLDIKDIINIKHPYKFRNIKQNWEEVFSQTPVNVEVYSTIKRTYDIEKTIDNEL